MKRALVLTLVVLILGVFAHAGPLSGSWDTGICFDADPADGAVTVTSLESDLGVAYEVCGWTFGMGMEFNYASGFDNVYFAVDGALGAFQFASKVDFDPTAANVSLDGFTYWKGYATLAIAGVDLFSGWILENGPGEGFMSGFMLGGYGTVGDCTIHVEVDFGIKRQLYYIFWSGLDYAYTYTFDATSDCGVAWTNFDFVAEIPFACVDLIAWINFDCVEGFDWAEFWVRDIDLGLSWLKIDWFDVMFPSPAAKQVWILLELITAETACITPYLSIVYNDRFGLEGIRLDALELEYTWNGITFIASEIFNPRNCVYESVCSATILVNRFNPGAGHPMPDLGNGANELIGFEIDGDSCCGGAFTAHVYNFFLFDPSGTPAPSGEIFNWHHTCAGLEYGISSTVTLNASMVVDGQGLSSMCFGFEFIW